MGNRSLYHRQRLRRSLGRALHGGNFGTQKGQLNNSRVKVWQRCVSDHITNRHEVDAAARGFMATTGQGWRVSAATPCPAKGALRSRHSSASPAVSCPARTAPSRISPLNLPGAGVRTYFSAMACRVALALEILRSLCDGPVRFAMTAAAGLEHSLVGGGPPHGSGAAPSTLGNGSALGQRHPVHVMGAKKPSARKRRGCRHRRPIRRLDCAAPRRG
mmetsp:Transcript_29721/g.81388  ORF Transcript_29721/g.81388 Transcript_29721/m.81388 type:complete len:217 (+) Transcript_29721:54-704(+)